MDSFNKDILEPLLSLLISGVGRMRDMINLKTGKRITKLPSDSSS